MRAALSFAGRVLAWAVILGSVAIILAAVLVPRVAGATPYTIITSSMEPSLPPGTLVIVKPVDPSEIRVGDVITVQLESGEDTVVTHRVSGIAQQLDGDVLFETKGDANDAPDTELRLPVQVRGEVWYSLPYLGYVSTALTGGERQWIITAIAIGLIVYALWMFWGAARERRQAREKEAEAASVNTEHTEETTTQ